MLKPQSKNCFKTYLKLFYYSFRQNCLFKTTKTLKTTSYFMIKNIRIFEINIPKRIFYSFKN